MTFNGPSLQLYGTRGPAFGSYSVSLDAGTPTTMSAYSSTNSSHFLLWEGTNLSPQKHALALTNLGSMGNATVGNGVLIDFAVEQITMGAVGATLTNTTVEDSDHVTLTYAGAWSSNNDTRFSGGTSTYTDGQGASVSLKFNGSAVYVFGDTVDDHGLASFSLDQQTSTANFASEFLKFDTLKFFAGNLSNQEHTLLITNFGPGFFDLDSIIFTVPSAYATIPPTSSSTNSTSSSSSSASTSSSSSSSSSTPATTPARTGSGSKLQTWKVASVLGFIGALFVI